MAYYENPYSRGIMRSAAEGGVKQAEDRKRREEKYKAEQEGRDKLNAALGVIAATLLTGGVAGVAGAGGAGAAGATGTAGAGTLAPTIGSSAVGTGLAAGASQALPTAATQTLGTAAATPMTLTPALAGTGAGAAVPSFMDKLVSGATAFGRKVIEPSNLIRGAKSGIKAMQANTPQEAIISGISGPVDEMASNMEYQKLLETFPQLKNLVPSEYERSGIKFKQPEEKIGEDARKALAEKLGLVPSGVTTKGAIEYGQSTLSEADRAAQAKRLGFVATGVDKDGKVVYGKPSEGKTPTLGSLSPKAAKVYNSAQSYLNQAKTQEDVDKVYKSISEASDITNENERSIIIKNLKPPTGIY